jgi:hypothetical protein
MSFTDLELLPLLRLSPYHACPSIRPIWMLQNSLGGNAFSTLICNVTPASSQADETHNTLRFATRARRVRTQPVRQVRLSVISMQHANACRPVVMFLAGADRTREAHQEVRGRDCAAQTRARHGTQGTWPRMSAHQICASDPCVLSLVLILRRKSRRAQAGRAPTIVVFGWQAVSTPPCLSTATISRSASISRSTSNNSLAQNEILGGCDQGTQTLPTCSAASLQGTDPIGCSLHGFVDKGFSCCEGVESLQREEILNPRPDAKQLQRQPESLPFAQVGLTLSIQSLLASISTTLLFRFCVTGAFRVSAIAHLPVGKGECSLCPAASIGPRPEHTSSTPGR